MGDEFFEVFTGRISPKKLADKSYKHWISACAGMTSGGKENAEAPIWIPACAGMTLEVF